MAAAFSRPAVTEWVRQNTWSFLVSFVASIATLGVLFFKRHSHPLNLVLLGTVRGPVRQILSLFRGDVRLADAGTSFLPAVYRSGVLHPRPHRVLRVRDSCAASSHHHRLHFFGTDALHVPVTL